MYFAEYPFYVPRFQHLILERTRMRLSNWKFLLLPRLLQFRVLTIFLFFFWFHQVAFLTVDEANFNE